MAFTAAEQREHRLTLARHLSRNVKDSAYNHGRFDKCALGHAAKRGIAGLYLDIGGTPRIRGVGFGFIAAEYAFGDKAYDEIFAGWNAHTRKDAIAALRNYID